MLSAESYDSLSLGERPSKKTKREDVSLCSIVEPANLTDGPAEVPPHPLGVRPKGNALVDGASPDLKIAAGCFALLPDELILQLLEYFCADELVAVGLTCKALYAFSRADELWKALIIESTPSNFDWLGSWRNTYLRIPQSRTIRINCTGLYSDALHRPYFCAHVPLHTYARRIPPKNAIPSLPDLPPDEFSTSWADKPFILTKPVKTWPIYDTWDPVKLLSEHGSTSFAAEAVQWRLAKYISYMTNNNDESPLYLFDHAFAEKMGLKLDDTPSPQSHDAPAYSPPEAFSTDYFRVLGPRRPHFRWLIMGPARSGSTFHQDPNGTSAWNAVLTGRKYWLMFPPSVLPPGVFLSPDRSEITSPLSIAEYLLSFHAEARAHPACREAVCGPGELLHVPSGWYHLVVNLDPSSVAVTQNFVPRARVGAVLKFLRDTSEQVTGFADDVTDPHALFVEGLERECPDVLREGMKWLECDDERGSKKTNGRSKWEELKDDLAAESKEARNGSSKAFSFGFEGDDSNSDAEVP